MMDNDPRTPKELKAYSEVSFSTDSNSSFIAGVKAEAGRRKRRRTAVYSISAGVASIVVVFAMTFNFNGNGAFDSAFEQELMALVDNSHTYSSSLLSFDDIDIITDVTDEIYTGEVDSVFNIFDDSDNEDTIGQLAELEDVQISEIFEQLRRESYL